MSKYIIEIEDEPFGRNDDPNIPHGMDELYRAKGFNSLVFDQFGLDKLTPLDKALSSELGEAYHKGFEVGQHEATTLEYQQGLDDAWECVRKLVANWLADVDYVFEDKSFVEFLDAYSASEAIKKVKAYEEQQKADDEIKVGDEVEAYSGIAVVFGTFTDAKGNKVCRYWYPSEDRFDKDKTENLKKTGRHFPQVVELIKAMKEGAE